MAEVIRVRGESPRIALGEVMPVGVGSRERCFGITLIILTSLGVPLATWGARAMDRINTVYHRLARRRADSQTA
jgi:hypothetical protein